MKRMMILFTITKGSLTMIVAAQDKNEGLKVANRKLAEKGDKTEITVGYLKPVGRQVEEVARCIVYKRAA